MSLKLIIQFTWNFIYSCLRAVNINFDRISQFTDLRKINLISMDQQSRREFTCEFSCWVLLCRVYFSNKVIKIYKQGNNALINWVGRSVQEYIALSLLRIGHDLSSVSQYGKGYNQVYSIVIKEVHNIHLIQFLFLSNLSLNIAFVHLLSRFLFTFFTSSRLCFQMTCSESNSAYWHNWQFLVFQSPLYFY